LDLVLEIVAFLLFFCWRNSFSPGGILYRCIPHEWARPP